MVKQLIGGHVGKVLELPDIMPWKEPLIGTDIDYVIFPSSRGGYCIQAVPTDDDKMKQKRPFPEAWRGLDRESLEEASGIKGLNFCHISGFLCASDNLESARKAAEKALE